jgi:uncharacterized membrane protein YeiH
MYAIQNWGDTLRLLVELSATAAFALSGLMEAARKRLDAVGVCVVAFLAAFGGGTLRDMVCNEIPTAFKDHRPYAVCAFSGGWTYVALWYFDAPGWVALLACLLVTVGLRALALWRNWQLPAWRA